MILKELLASWTSEGSLNEKISADEQYLKVMTSKMFLMEEWLSGGHSYRRKTEQSEVIIKELD